MSTCLSILFCVRDMWLSSTLHLKNGLNRLFSLVPYELITQEIWNSVMPHWLDAVTKDVPVKELNHFKMLFRYVTFRELNVFFALGYGNLFSYNY